MNPKGIIFHCEMKIGTTSVSLHIVELVLSLCFDANNLSETLSTTLFS